MDFLFPVTGLQTPLVWCWTITNADNWIQHWDWFTSEDRNFLFRQFGENAWRRHLRVVGTQRSFHKQFLVLQHPAPLTSLRATVRESRETWILTSTNFEHTIQTDDRIPPDITFDAIDVATPTIPWFFHHLDSSQSTSMRLLQHLQSGIAIAVSDGS